MSTDKAWKKYGEENPYFGVLSDDRYRGKQLSQEVLREFYQSGEQIVMELFAKLESKNKKIDTTRALDFGCGVGRLTIPLAGHFKSVVGVDVSPQMIAEAIKNCGVLGIHNARFAEKLEDLYGEAGSFSFAITHIVLQHIAPERGLKILENIIDLLGKGGSASIHMTYGRSKDKFNYGERTAASLCMRAIRRPLSRAQRALTGRDPEMQMNYYPLNKVMFILQSAGIEELDSEFTDHGGHLGITFNFRKPG